MSSSAIYLSDLSRLTATGLPRYWTVNVVGLLLLLLLKEILSESKLKGKALESSLNMGIAPLFISFIAIIVYRIVMIF
ncbi:hypothetical protein EQO05_01555 [Methanosarcina sp. MSH10X1]|nr:hypothetical protein EQO05_01555 [Methanosarcina sp. MSH10X1]